jgi:hypothetical protein
MSIFAYYNIIKSYWDELNTLTTIPECSCGALQELNQMQEIECVFQFLIGLNESYASICSQILAMDPLPNVGKVYSIIHQEEKQRLLHLPTSNSDSIAMAANQTFLQSHPNES